MYRVGSITDGIVIRVGQRSIEYWLAQAVDDRLPGKSRQEAKSHAEGIAEMLRALLRKEAA